MVSPSWEQQIGIRLGARNYWRRASEICIGVRPWGAHESWAGLAPDGLVTTIHGLDHHGLA